MSAFLLRFQHGYIPSGALNRSLSGQRSQSAAGLVAIPNSNYVIYANGVLDLVNFKLAKDLSFQCTKNYTASFGGQTCLQISTNTAFGGGWQPASNWDPIPPAGFDMSAYTKLRFDINIPNNVGLYLGAHYTRATGNDLSTSTSATQGSTCFSGITANTWTTVEVPLANIASLSSYNFYKFAIGTNQNNQVYYLNNVQLIPGNTSWIFRGSSGLESPWLQAGAGATFTYSFLPGSLNANLYAINNPKAPAAVLNGSVAGQVLTVNSMTSGTINFGDALFYNASQQTTISSQIDSTHWNLFPAGAATANNIAMGTAPLQSSVTVIQAVSTQVNPIWQTSVASPFDITPYSTFTFGAIPTKSGYGYSIRLLAVGGGFVGNAVTAAPYTIHDFGISTSNWTVFNVPLSAFGTLPSTIAGVRIVETSANTTNVWYMSAVGFYS